MAVWSKTLDYSCHAVGHTWEPSCVKSAIEVGYHGYKESFKVYAPVYLLAAILQRKKLDYYLRRYLPETLQSTLFLGSNAFLFISTFCIWRRIFGFFFFFNVFACVIPTSAVVYHIEKKKRRVSGKFTFLSVIFLPSLCGCFMSILLERKSRRAMLAVYLANLATECVYRMGKSRGYWAPLWNGEVLLFSIVSALYMFLFKRPHGLKGSTSSGISFLVGSSEKSCDTTSIVDRSAGPAHNKPLSRSWLSLLPKELQAVIRGWQDGARHRLCKHQHGCLASLLQQSIHSAGLGYAIQGTIKLLGALPKLFKNPRAIIQAVRHKDNFHLAAFLGCFTAIFKAVCCALRWVRDEDRGLHGLLAGFLAGWSMLFYKSSSVALYMASKLAEILYFKGIASGHLPYLKYADVILYTLSTSLVFHCAVFEPHNIRPAYWNFLLRLTNTRFETMNRHLLDCYGTKASKMYPNFVPRLDDSFWRGQRF